MATMTPTQIISRITDRFPDSPLLAEHPEDKHPRLHIDAAHWPELAAFLRHDPELAFDWLANLSGVDYVADNQLCVVYDLWSFEHRHSFAIKVFCDRENPRIASVTSHWPAANWHEREAFDLLGIEFIGHPDLRRILLNDDWVGYPLRKDYEFPREYHGIPATFEPVPPPASTD